jgi:hypothetical protein
MANPEYDVIPGTQVSQDPLYVGMDVAVDTTTHRDYNLEQMDVEGGLHKFSWDSDLQTLATLNDVFDMGMSDTVDIYANNKGFTIPDAIGISAKAGGAAITHTFPVIDPYAGGVRAGINEDVLGYEKGHRLRYIQALYNEVGTGVITEEYGVLANRINTYGVYDSVNQRIAKFWAEIKGRMKREALTQVYNRELNKPGSTGSYSAGVDQYYNPNWIIANATTNLSTNTNGLGMPIYSSTFATFETNIKVALIDAAEKAAAGDVTDAWISAQQLDRISQIAHRTLITPLDDNTYCAVIPEEQWYKLSAITGDLGSLWVAQARYNDTQEAIKFPGEVGMYRNLRIVPDSRFATLTVGGTAAVPTTVTIGYQEPGGAIGDNRAYGAYATDTNMVFQLGWLCGKGAYIERKEKDLFYREEVQNYAKKKGLGSFMECGYNLTIIRTDSATGTQGMPDYAENRGSAVLAFASPTF